MRSVPSKVYDSSYYRDINDGGKTFFKTAGKVISRRVIVSINQVEIKKSDVVLDFGCGRGDLVFYTASKCRNVIGIDYSDYAIQICNKIKKKHYSEYNNIHFYKSSVKSLKLKNNSLDKVFLLDLVEHLYPEELDLLLQKLRGAMKKGAVLVIHTCPNTNFYKYGYPVIRFFYPIIRLVPAFKKLLDTKPNWKGLKKLPKDPEINSHNKIGHVNEMSPKKLREILVLNGFIANIKTYPFLRDLKSIGLKLVYVILLIPPLKLMFSADIMAVAKKK